MAAAGWTHYDHQADIGLRGFGPTLSEAFAQTALALTGVVTHPEAVRPETAVSLECWAADAEFLLVEWLDELIYRMATRDFLYGRFAVTVDEDGTHLTATAWGEPLDRKRHQPAVEIKGATLTDLRVARDGEGGWSAQCVVDV